MCVGNAESDGANAKSDDGGDGNPGNDFGEENDIFFLVFVLRRLPLPCVFCQRRAPSPVPAPSLPRSSQCPHLRTRP